MPASEMLTRREPYSTDDVARMARVSYRQLDYWERTGLVVPSIREARGSGSQRRWSEADLLTVKVIRVLLDASISLQKIRRILEDPRQTTDVRSALDKADELLLARIVG